MIPTIKKDDKDLVINYNYKFKDGVEADTYAATYKGKPVITKFFIKRECIENKIKKMILIKERTKDIDIVVTADAFIEEHGEIKGYMMQNINGINVYNESLNCKSKYLIWYLKELAEGLKKLHNLGIIAGDFTHNTLVKDGKLYFIDHDNFIIDGYKIDMKNRLVKKYISINGKIDENLDFYLLNLYTFTLFRHYNLPTIYETYGMNQDIFYFKDKEIRELFEKTIKLDESFNGQLIIDKINSTKDIKKIKSKLF